VRGLALLKTGQMIIHRVKKERLPRQQAKPFFCTRVSACTCACFLSTTPPPEAAHCSFKVFCYITAEDISDACRHVIVLSQC
jgi:hypothetical protein